MNLETMLMIQSELDSLNQPKEAIAIRHISEKRKNSCELCSAFNGRVFKIPEQENEIPRLPLRPNCKCRQVPIHDKAEYIRLTQIDSAIVRVDKSDGLGGIRISGIDDMLQKLEQAYPNGGIKKLIISNHGGHPGSFPMGNSDDLRHIVNNPRQLERLKKLLAQDAMIDIRMCFTSEGKEGNESAQKSANTLGVKILGYEGPVSPLGTRPRNVKPDEEHQYKFHQRFFPAHKPKVFTPEKAN